ncbi:MAG TPA: methylated-DNA--[protein]-cysteine S-methyltransferase [Paracoccaceae bacterium]|nr:methylated-DNA--[protein]-cysteine S-methyltransferase [Paracoccaceae bacterium]
MSAAELPVPSRSARSVRTPLGWLCVTEEDGAIIALDWRCSGADETPLLVEAGRQLAAYFEGRLQVFDLPLRPAGDALQSQVAAAMRAIPFGRTREYGEIAREIGAPPQAIGQACGRNTIPVIIPCHRVVGAGGLGGFSAPGGIETKVALLRHEGAYSLLL